MKNTRPEFIVGDNEMIIYRIEAEVRFRNQVDADKWFNGVEIEEEPQMTVLSSRQPDTRDSGRDHELAQETEKEFICACGERFPNEMQYLAHLPLGQE